MHKTLLGAETTFEMPELQTSVSFQFQQAVSKHGSRRLPSLFYEGVTLGLTSGNSHDIEVRLTLISLISSSLFLTIRHTFSLSAYLPQLPQDPRSMD